MKTAILSSILTVGLGASAWAEGTPLDIAVGDSIVIDNFADEDLNSAINNIISKIYANSVPSLQKTV